MKEASYPEVRDRMRPGDLIFFGGKSAISDGIKFFTRSAASHVAIVRQTKAVDDAEPGRFFNEVIESTSLGGFLGVTASRLSVRVETYAGKMWWAPLNEFTQERLNVQAMWDFLYEQEGKPYDTLGAMKAGIDLFGDRFLHGKEDFSKFFCSELVAGALEAGGVLPPLNASEVVPQDLAEMQLYGHLYQIKGTREEIRGFNSTPPDVAARRFQ